MLHQDMVWHVTLDFIDIVYMFQYGRPQDIFRTVNNKEPNEEEKEFHERMRIYAGVFIFLSLFFHMQSYAGMPWRKATYDIETEEDF